MTRHSPRTQLELTPSEIDRFRSKIAPPDANGCADWTGETNNRGYGRFIVYRGKERVRILTHRLAYFLAHGHWPMVGIHACDRPVCCSAEHIGNGTQMENMRDARSKGRSNVVGLDAYRSDLMKQARLKAAARIHAQEKACFRCKRVHPFTRFGRDDNSLDGRGNECRSCRNEQQNARRKRKRQQAMGGVA